MGYNISYNESVYKEAVKRLVKWYSEYNLSVNTNQTKEFIDSPDGFLLPHYRKNADVLHFGMVHQLHISVAGYQVLLRISLEYSFQPWSTSTDHFAYTKRT